MPFNIFNHKNGRARRPVPKKHHHKKLVISEMRGEKALIHSESLVLDTQLFHFTAAAIKSFVCYIFMCPGKEGEKLCIRNNVNGLMDSLSRYLEKKNKLLLSQFLREHKKGNFYFDVNVGGWRNKQNCWCFVCRMLVVTCRFRKLFFHPCSYFQSNDNKGKT